MANQQHVDMLLAPDGVAVWSRWRKQEPDVHPDLRETDLRETDLRAAALPIRRRWRDSH
jgi:hypothetical protein